MILTPTSLAASLAKWSGVRPQRARENLRKPENLTLKCTKLHVMALHSNFLVNLGSLAFQFVSRLSRLTCQETPHNSERSRDSGRFRPWHRQLRDFAAAAGRTFRLPGRRHCGAPSGLGDKRRTHLNCTTTSCLLHPATLLHYTTEETANAAKAWQKGGNGNPLLATQAVFFFAVRPRLNFGPAAQPVLLLDISALLRCHVLALA